jgi:hypothetical protein
MTSSALASSGSIHEVLSAKRRQQFECCLEVGGRSGSGRSKSPYLVSGPAFIVLK